MKLDLVWWYLPTGFKLFLLRFQGFFKILDRDVLPELVLKPDPFKITCKFMERKSYCRILSTPIYAGFSSSRWLLPAFPYRPYNAKKNKRRQKHCYTCHCHKENVWIINLVKLCCNMFMLPVTPWDHTVSALHWKDALFLMDFCIRSMW